VAPPHLVDYEDRRDSTQRVHLGSETFLEAPLHDYRRHRAVVEDISISGGGSGRVHGDVRRARLEDSEYCRHGVGGLAKVKANAVAHSHALGAEPIPHPGGELL
jgi:hypothetical protein